MFHIAEITEARLATLTSRTEKHGDEDKPAVSLGMEVETTNFILDLIDPKLRHALYMAVDEGAQSDIPDIQKSTPVLRCNSIDRVTLPTKHEGWTLNVDADIEEDNPMAFGSCKVDKFTVEPKQGGSIILRFRVGTSDLDKDRSGMLGMHVGQPIWITLVAPKKQAEAIDGSQAAFDQDHPPGGDATDLFAAGADGEAGTGEGRNADEEFIDQHTT